MHTWYLGVEEQLYLLYPWIFALAHRYANSHYRLAPYVVYGALFLLSIVGALVIDDQQRMEKGFFSIAVPRMGGIGRCYHLPFTSVFEMDHCYPNKKR